MEGPEDDVVIATQAHGRTLHNMGASGDQVIAMAIKVPSERRD
jgi:hypothetical protein